MKRSVPVDAQLIVRDDSEGGASGSGSSGSGRVSGPESRLTVLSTGPVQAWDPQRITSRQVAGLASRTWMRTLTAYQPEVNLAAQRKLRGDLATTPGVASNGRGGQ